MSLLKILVVEDEVLIAEHIKDHLISFGMKEIHFADSKDVALQMIETLAPQLILLDLYLENPLDGLELAKIIDETCLTPYIFITANADQLTIQQAVHTNAAAYITKPIKKSDLFAAIQIALKSVSGNDVKFLQVKNAGSTVRLPVNEIQYIESNGNYIHIYTKKGKTLSRQSLEWVEEQLPGNIFLRIHRSFLVNVNFVSRINSRTLFIEETEIPISRTISSEVSKYFKENQ